MKRCGKSAPGPGASRDAGKPHPEQGQIEGLLPSWRAAPGCLSPGRPHRSLPATGGPDRWPPPRKRGTESGLQALLALVLLEWRGYARTNKVGRMEELQVARDGLGLVGDLYNSGRILSAVLRRVNRTFEKAQEINPNLDFQSMPDESLLFANAAARRIADSVEMDEEIENLWARLIADGCVNTGKYSTRTLNVVKSMSPREAYFFQTVAPFCFGKQTDGGIIPELIWLVQDDSDEILKRSFSPIFPPSVHAYYYAAINALIDAGLAYTGREFLNAGNGISPLHYGGSIVDTLLPGRQMALGNYHLTSAGLQLHPLVTDEEVTVEGYMDALKDHIAQSNLIGPRHPAYSQPE